MNDTYRAALFGYGNIAQGYEDNKEYTKVYPIPTHLSAIENNNNIVLDTVVDSDMRALEKANKKGIKNLGKTINDIDNKESIDILVLACPPDVNKLEIIKSFPVLKGIVLEKPISKDVKESTKIFNHVSKLNIKTQVAYLRRFDNFILNLLNGNFENLIGKPQSAQVIYGNGIMNNGSHLLDLSRMLLGEFKKISKPILSNIPQTTLKDDLNLSCILQSEYGVNLSLIPIDFKYYRENSLDIWGTKGRLAFNQEGSYFTYWKVLNSRFGKMYKEIDWANPSKIGATKLGYSMGNIYTNLVMSIRNNQELLSPISSAVETERLVHEIINYSNEI